MSPSPEPPVRVAVIGAGLIAQSVHLPHLTAPGSGFEVVVLADLSAELAGAVARRFGIPRHTPDWRSALDADVDAVIVLTGSSTHAEIVLAALDRGRDVLLEKPMCVALSDADRIVAATEGSGRIVQIGYMRRSDALVPVLDAQLAARGLARFLRVETHEGPISRFVAGYGILRARPAEADAAAFSESRRAQAAEAIGTDDPALGELYLAVLLESAVHELGFLARWFGAPSSIEHAVPLKGESGVQFSASFRGIPLDYAFYTFDGLPRFRQRIDVYFDDALVTASFDSPFTRDAPGRLEIVEPVDGDEVRTVRDFDREDGFRRQLARFRDSVRDRVPPEVGPVQAREDLRTCVAIVESIRTGERVVVDRPVNGQHNEGESA